VSFGVPAKLPPEPEPVASLSIKLESARFVVQAWTRPTNASTHFTEGEEGRQTQAERQELPQQTTDATPVASGKTAGRRYDRRMGGRLV
jgi:hypothetical protein